MEFPISRDNHITIPLYVILSGENLEKVSLSKFCGLSEANEQNRGANATMGSPNKFW